LESTTGEKSGLFVLSENLEFHFKGVSATFPRIRIMAARKEKAISPRQRRTGVCHLSPRKKLPWNAETSLKPPPFVARCLVRSPQQEESLMNIPLIPSPGIRKGDMLYRILGRTGQQVSAIGIGGFHIGQHNLTHPECKTFDARQ
jgi:hypothetical protein